MDSADSVGSVDSGDARAAIKLLQGYVWYPREAEVVLGAYLPERLEPDIYLLWDEVRPPFTFFDDGTFAASQHFFQLTVLKLNYDPDHDTPEALVPWLAETLQQRLETTPPGVGWQIFEDLRRV